LRENESGIFLIPGLDTISENQKRFARRAGLSQRCIEIALAGKANQFAGQGWARVRLRRAVCLVVPAK
jgi:hypothetical protein